MMARALPLLVSPILFGCSASVISDGGGDAETTKTSAIVLVERTADATGSARVEVSARFVRVVAPASIDEAWRAIGAAAALPASGTCRALASLAGTIAADAPTPVVELLDVGAVSMEVGDAAMRLLARQLPDVTDVVSGVVYSRIGETATLTPGARYRLRVAGGRSLPGFDAVAVAPDDPSDVRVAGEDVPGRIEAVPPGTSALEVTWPEPAGGGDLVYADLQPSAVRCALYDPAPENGVARASVPLPPPGERRSIVLHRLRREPLGASGLAGGEIRFDFARAIALGAR